MTRVSINGVHVKRDDATIRAKRHVLRMKLSSIFLPAIALAALVSGSAYAATDACQPIRNAIEKENAANQMQVSSVLTYTDSGRSYYYDHLYSRDRYYWRNRNGPWELYPRRPVPLLADGKPAVYDCRFAGTDRIGGATVAVYTYKHFYPDHEVLEFTGWIDADSGKFLQTEQSGRPLSDHKTMYTFSYGPNPPLPAVDERVLWHPPH